jgi:hypothetical protein
LNNSHIRVEEKMAEKYIHPSRCITFSHRSVGCIRDVVNVTISVIAKTIASKLNARTRYAL